MPLISLKSSERRKQLEMQSIFNELDSRPQKVSSKLLDVSLATRQKHHFASDPKSFLSKYEKIFHKKPTLCIESSHSYDAGNPYYCSNVCFVQKEKYSSASHPYLEPKNNTYTLCPYCDPFNKANGTGSKKKTKKRDGKEVAIEDNEPQFFDTLHSEYEHHMSQVHGIKKSEIMAQPFVGFSMTQITKSQKPDVYRLNCICPYSKGDANEPCLAEFSFRHDEKNGNPYKAYFRHVNKCHFSKVSSSSDFSYQPYVQSSTGEVFPNLCYPLDEKKWGQSLQFLRTQCHDQTINPLMVCQDQQLLHKCAGYVSRIDEVKQLPTHSFAPNLVVSLVNKSAYSSDFLNRSVDELLKDLPSISEFSPCSSSSSEMTWSTNTSIIEQVIPDVDCMQHQTILSGPVSPISSPSSKKRKLESCSEVAQKKAHHNPSPQQENKEPADQTYIGLSNESDSDSIDSEEPPAPAPVYCGFEPDKFSLSDFDEILGDGTIILDEQTVYERWIESLPQN